MCFFIFAAILIPKSSRGSFNFIKKYKTTQSLFLLLNWCFFFASVWINYNYLLHDKYKMCTKKKRAQASFIFCEKRYKINILIACAYVFYICENLKYILSFIMCGNRVIKKNTRTYRTGFKFLAFSVNKLKKNNHYHLIRFSCATFHFFANIFV